MNPPRPEIRPQRDTSNMYLTRADNSLCTRYCCSKHYEGEMNPASSARCYRCDKRDHYMHCFSGKTSADANQVSLDSAFLDTVGTFIDYQSIN